MNYQPLDAARLLRNKGARQIAGTCLVIALILFTMPAAAQVAVGDNVKLSLGGDLSTGYTGTFGDMGSSHGLSFGGNATLHGYYYNPQFLSFDFQPFYNRSQANSTYQSITNSSGFVGSANFFSGSRFPGSVSVDRTFDNTGQFGIPGVTGLETSGSGQTISINWSALVPDWPTLRASYIITGTDVSIPGANGTSHTSSRMFSLGSDYRVRGYQLRGFLGHGSGHSEFPGFLVGERSGNLENGSNYYGGQVTHALPLRGYWTAQVTHSTFGSDFGNAGVTGSSDSSNTGIGTTVSINPLPRLGVGVGADYQTNAFATFQQQVVEAGGSNPIRLSHDSSTFGVHGTAAYSILHYVYITGNFSHREQRLLGRNLATTQYGGGVSSRFSHRLLGSLTFSVGANNTATQEGNNGIGLYGNVDFGRRIDGWELTANFNYTQWVQTLLTVYNTSVYGYGTGVKRKFRKDLYWGATFIGNHSGLERVEGSNSRANTVSTYMHFHRYNVNAVYSQSAGVSILTPQGLVPVPGGTPTPLLTDTVLYNAKSYGGGFGVTLKRLNIIASYGRALSGLTAATGPVSNDSRILNARVQYRVRRMYFNSGFTQFNQRIGSTGLQPVVLNSFYVGFSRWFNVF